MSRLSHTPELINVVQFNLTSARLQRKAGVDPAACLKIEETDSQHWTDWDDFFAGLEQGVYRTAAGGRPRQHDQNVHFARVRDTEPTNVAFVNRCGQAGRRLVAYGNEREAERLGRLADSFLSRVGLVHRIILIELLPRIDGLSAADAVTQSQVLVDAQITHTAAMVAAAANLAA
jgi:hypothetical protein